LRWLDGAPLKLEDYRRRIFEAVLDTVGPDGFPVYNLALLGRGKKNNKTLDLILSGLYCHLVRQSPQGNDVFILANDEHQADDDLSLAKKLVQCNPDLAARVEILQKEIRRTDGRGAMRILPAQNVAGQHGKTALFVGFDEIHSYRDWDLLEALQPDPSRPDALTWITSYDTIYDSEGVPLHDLKLMGKAGTDPKMFFSWYSADYCTDPNFADLEPDLRANPSLSSWPEGRKYLEQQRRRLPSNRFRRLHHNLPGSPSGSFFDQQVIEDAIVAGRTALEPRAGVDYCAAVDMSGGSSDDAVLCIGHTEGKKTVIDLIISQAGAPPFNPRHAVARFADYLRRYRVRRVTGDAYAGETFRSDFAEHGFSYQVCERTTSQNYEELEVVFNGGEVELPDVAKLRQQLCTLVVRGAKIDHLPNAHDDYAAACACCVVMMAVPSSADRWISHFATLAGRARHASQTPDDEEWVDSRRPSRRSNPRRADEEGDARAVASAGHKHHPMQPLASVGNSVCDTYFATLSKLEGRTMAMQAPTCAWCGAETVGTRLSDGVRNWCHVGCQQNWIKACAEQNRARAAAERGARPVMQPRCS
jgi:hypothetical protein